MVVRVWHEKAAGDLEAARACLESPRVPGWIVGFHLQQAVEKALKGLLVLAEREAPRTHDLAALHRLLKEAGGVHPLTPEELQALQPFAVDERYPILSPQPVAREEVAPLMDPAARIVDALAARLSG